MTAAQASDLIAAFDEYQDARGGLYAAVDGPEDKRIVRHRKCRERLVSLLREIFADPLPPHFAGPYR